MKPLIAIVGPTAVGKSKLALALARKFNGEIINADSRQIYRYMDIGTAKPSLEDRNLIPHHLIDIVNPDEQFSLALYQKLASEAVNLIWQRDKIPFLVGGTGLYIWAFLEGWSVPEVPPDPEFRRRKEAEARSKGKEALFKELEKVDPEQAKKIDPRNVRRVIRALEVYQATGIPFSQLQRRNPPPFSTLIIGLTTAREELYRRIDARVEKMIEQGLIEETKRLVEKGYGFELPSMSGIGYKEIGLFLQGKLSLPEAIQRIKFETHRFARHQYAWFRLNDSRIHWLDVSSEFENQAAELVSQFLARGVTHEIHKVSSYRQ